MPPEIAAPVAIVPYWSYWLPSLIGAVQIGALIWMNRQVSATAVSVEKAHVAINSERKAMQDELKKLHEVILAMTQEKMSREAGGTS